MFSSLNIKSLTFLMSVILVAVGCGLKIGEKAPQSEIAEVKSVQCFKKSLTDFKVFFAGDASDDQIATSMDCLGHVFVAFKVNVRGQDKKSFTAKEIATFVEKNFLQDTKTHFSDDFLAQLMLFKVALFGGDDQRILKSEIDLIVEFMARFKPELVKLNPHMKILNMKWAESLKLNSHIDKENQFLAAQVQFESFMQKLASEFSAGKRAYSLDHLLSFAVEIVRLAEAKTDSIDTIEKARPFIKKFKSSFIGGDNSLKGTEWEGFGSIVSVGYFQVLRQKYFLKDIEPNQFDEKWLAYEKIASDVSLLIANLLNIKPTHAILNTEIIDLLKISNDLFPKVELSEELLNQIGDVKISILGESAVGRSGWSNSDFAGLFKKVPGLLRSLKTVVKQFDYLSLNHEASFRSQLSYEKFQNARVEVLLAANDFGQLFQHSYHLESLKELLVSLSEGPLKKYIHLPENFNSLFKAAVSLKTMLTGQTSLKLDAKDLKLIVVVGASAYLNYIEYDLFLSAYRFESLDFMSSFEKLWPNLKSTLKTELRLKPENTITSDEIKQLILVLQEEKILHTNIRGESLDSLFQALWKNIFNKPEDRLNGIVRPGCDRP
jgi:hypothetical protein